MDDVQYRREGDVNIVTLVKRLQGHGAADGRGGRTMEVTTRTAGHVTVFAIVGKLDSITSPQAQQALDAVLAGGVKKLAVDFTALDYVSSAGLRVLLSAAKKLGAGGLRMYGLNQSVREVFDISGFSAILPVFAGEAEALAGF
jgi:anti-anti-sigma factor